MNFNMYIIMKVISLYKQRVRSVKVSTTHPRLAPHSMCAQSLCCCYMTSITYTAPNAWV